MPSLTGTCYESLKPVWVWRSELSLVLLQASPSLGPVVPMHLTLSVHHFFSIWKQNVGSVTLQIQDDSFRRWLSVVALSNLDTLYKINQFGKWFFLFLQPPRHVIVSPNTYLWLYGSISTKSKSWWRHPQLHTRTIHCQQPLQNLIHIKPFSHYCLKENPLIQSFQLNYLLKKQKPQIKSNSLRSRRQYDRLVLLLLIFSSWLKIPPWHKTLLREMLIKHYDANQLFLLTENIQQSRGFSQQKEQFENLLVSFTSLEMMSPLRIENKLSWKYWKKRPASWSRDYLPRLDIEMKLGEIFTFSLSVLSVCW